MVGRRKNQLHEEGNPSPQASVNRWLEGRGKRRERLENAAQRVLSCMVRILAEDVGRKLDCFSMPPART